MRIGNTPRLMDIHLLGIYSLVDVASHVDRNV